MPHVIRGPYELIETRGYPDDAEFEPRPSALVLIAGFEVVVRDSFGHYLLVTSPQYEKVETASQSPAARAESSFWTVPYITKTIKAPDEGFKNVHPTIEAIDQAIKSWKPQAKLMAYAQTFSIGATSVKLVSEFCELKRSWSQPNVTALYHIMRYRLVLGNCAHRNLADAASRKGYTFIPVDDERYTRVTKKRKCNVHKRSETLYQSQPLTSNLSAVLDDPERRIELRTHAVQLDRDHFSQEFTGILFCGDIAGYGAATAYAAKYMGGFDDVDHGSVLRDSATVGFTEIFLEAGISQVFMAGDGFICALPVFKEREIRTELKRFAKAYGEYLGRLDDLGKRIAEHFDSNPQKGMKAPTLGSRLAVHYGDYRYGKMSEAVSQLTSFDGASIVTVSRLEQGLGSISKSQTLARRYDIADERHLAAASTAVTDNEGETPFPGVFDSVEFVEAASKEYRGKALLMRAARERTGAKGRRKQ